MNNIRNPMIFATKKIFRIISIILLIAFTLLLLNYARLSALYLINKRYYKETFNILGNNNFYVPQGLTYSEKYDVVLQTSYNSKRDISMLYITNFSTGKFIKTLKLIEVDGSDNTEHVGGITTDDNTVWITNNYMVNEFSLDEIMSTENDFIRSKNNYELPNRGDFCSYDNNILWIGDFCIRPFFKVPNNNPLLMGYKVANKIDFSKPDYIVSLPKIVQGMAITPENDFIFTSSFTYFIHSTLAIYKNPLECEYEVYDINGKKVPYYKLDKSRLIKSIKLPPMAEELFYKDGKVYILFESSSDVYINAFPKMKKVIELNIKY